MCTPSRSPQSLSLWGFCHEDEIEAGKVFQCWSIEFDLWNYIDFSLIMVRKCINPFVSPAASSLLTPLSLEIRHVSCEGLKCTIYWRLSLASCQ
mmetsp:Transcript_32646/g.24113  ORF Transcript_32646/g.24113 Transcript_32646/m.24113 type:complete len:94 (-) Transcript_32646:514-795(-)